MNVGTIKARIWERLDDTNPGTYYGATSVLDAINEAQRLWCLLTLAIEATSAITLTANQAEYTNLRTLITNGGGPSYLVPLRLTLVVCDGTVPVVKPATIHELDALSETWLSTPGVPTKYVTRGFDYLAVNPQPTSGMAASLVHAAEPTTLTADGNTPQMPEAHHPDLIDFCEYRLRKKEGGQELEKTLARLDRFLAGAKKYGEFTRARSLSQAHDRGPFERDRFDRSRLLRLIKLMKIVPQIRPGAPKEMEMQSV